MRNGFTAIVAVAVLALVAPAHATSTWNNQFRTSYPAAAGSRIDSCTLCHTSVPALNSYGNAYKNANHSFSAIAAADSDGDTFTNGVEIAGFFFPGNAADHPAPAVDATAPSVTGFSIPAASTSLTVSITTLTATDNVAVSGYLVNQSAAKPAAGAAGWTAAKPASYTFAAAGAQTLYAYAKDAAGNVSSGVAATVTITLPPAADTVPPTVSAFSIPATSTSLTVPILGITATDNAGVTGFLVNQSATKPAAGAAGWAATAPWSYTFTSAGAQTLYAYAKDAAGNVSNGRAASVTISIPPIPDVTAPTVLNFSVPPTASSLTVPVLAFAANDDKAVTGYLITESATKPAAGAAGWRTAPPASYTAATGGTHTLYAYAKDAAGNVSTGASASVTITAGTGAEYLFADDFADATAQGDPDWDLVTGKFAGRQGQFITLGRANNLALARDAIALDPFLGGRIEVDVRILRPSADTQAGIVFDYRDGTHYRYVLFSVNRRTITIGEIDWDGPGTVNRSNRSTQRVAVRATRGAWHHLAVDLDSVSGTVNVYLDAAALPAATKAFSSVGQGRVGIRAYHASLKATFDNFSVQDASALP